MTSTCTFRSRSGAVESFPQAATPNPLTLSLDQTSSFLNSQNLPLSSHEADLSRRLHVRNRARSVVLESGDLTRDRSRPTHLT